MLGIRFLAVSIKGIGFSSDLPLPCTQKWLLIPLMWYHEALCLVIRDYHDVQMMTLSAFLLLVIITWQTQ